MCKTSGECINGNSTCDGDADCPIGDNSYADDESFSDDGPCNIKNNNCTFNGKKSLELKYFDGKNDNF